MNNLNKNQMLMILFILIIGVTYIIFKPDGATLPGIPTSPSSDFNIMPTDSNINDNTSLNIIKWNTDNNIPVYFVRARELPMVDISVTFNAGSAYNTKQPGVAMLTNAILVEGTKKYNTEQISEKLEDIGAEYSAGSSKDGADVSLRTLTETKKLDSAISIFTDILANASFPNKSFNRLKKQSIENLKLKQQYPENIVSENFYKKIYNTHPYAIPSDGTIDSIKNINKRDLVKFYKNFYVSNNARISMVGNLSEEQAKTIANKISASLKPGEKAPSLPKAEKLNELVSQHINFPSTQTHIILGSVGIKRNDSDYFPLTVGNHILGRMPLTSLLFKSIRIEQGLAYSVYSSFVPMQNEGPFFVTMQTRNEKAKDALEITVKTLNDFITNGPSDEQLELAKQNLTGRFPLSIGSNSKKLGIISAIGFYDLPLDYLDTYIKNINTVTKDDIKAAFKKHVDLKKMAIVTVGNKEDELKKVS